MKIFIRFIIFLLIFSIFSSHLTVFATPSNNLNISAKSACLLDADSGKVLYSKNSHKQMPMASTTKVMTAIIALEASTPLSKEISIPKEAVGIEGSSIYLAEGEKITIEALLYALLLSSANDAAIAIAIAICGNVEDFVSLMNKKASSLGLTNTHFVNPHGLYDENHYTTAYDLARLMAYATKNPTFVEISGCAKKVFPKEDNGVRVYINHNKLLSMFDDIIAGKTGFTKKSGRCLVSAALRDNLKLIVVTLDAPSDWNDHQNLYNFGYDNYSKIVFEPITFNLAVIGGKSNSVTISSKKETSFLLPKSNSQIKSIIKCPRFLFANVNKGDIVGQVQYFYNGKLFFCTPLVAHETVEQIKYRFNLFDFLKELLF